MGASDFLITPTETNRWCIKLELIERIYDYGTSVRSFLSFLAASIDLFYNLLFLFLRGFLLFPATRRVATSSEALHRSAAIVDTFTAHSNFEIGRYFNTFMYDDCRFFWLLN